ncbi:MAG: M1 family aminopeptidase [Chitinophagales bacterium]
MEYPMITILDDYKDEAYLESVIAHEVAHNWWQGILASNERDNPWIDEGFTSYYEKRYNNEHAYIEYQPATIVSERKVAKFFGLDEVTYESGEKILLRQIENKNTHQAVGLHATKFTDDNTYFSLYAKAPHQIIYLENYLGRTQFDACIKSFFEAYQFKHIHPNDIQTHFESCSGKDLNFFFQDWINSDGIVNGKIGKVSKEGESLKVEIKQTGEVVMPLPVTIINEDGEQTIWVEGESTFIDVPSAGLKEIIVDRKNLSMDHQPADNFYKTNGIGKLEKVRPQLFFSLDNPKRTEIYFSPMMAGNAHDKFMLGLTVYNRFYPSKNLDWDITPLYAFGSKQVNGIFNLSYAQNIRKDRHVQLKYGVHFKTFSYDNRSFGGRYINVRPTLLVTILPEDRRKKITHQLIYKHHQTWNELNISKSDGTDSITQYSPLWVEEIGYSFEKKDIKTPVNASTNMQFNNEHAKITATTNVKVRYGKLDSYFSTRFWMSAFIAKQGDFARSSQFGTNYSTNLGGRNGNRDYLYEDYYLGRNVRDGFLSNQIGMNEGQFKFAPSSLLTSNILAASINLRADFPSKWIPIKLYTDIGIIYTNGFVAGNIEKKSLFAFQAGAMLSLFNEALEVYFPFVSSNDIKEYYELNAPKLKTASDFSIDLNKINPHKIVNEFEL